MKITIKENTLTLEFAAAQPTELVKGWWAHTCPEDGVIDVVPYQLTPADKRAGWVEYDIYTKPAPQPAAQQTGLIVSKHLDPLTGAGIPDPTTFGEKQ